MTRRFAYITLIVALAYVFSRFVAYDLGSLSYFAPAEKANDYETVDFYQTVANSRPQREYFEGMVLVPVDSLSRAEIAEVISAIAFCEPAVTGLDMVFDYPQPGVDDELRDAIAALPLAVVPDTAAYIYADVAGLRQGIVDLDAESRISIVRSYKTPGTMAGELAAVVASGALPAAGLLEFGTYDFEVVLPEEILESEDLLRGAIVLVGTLKDENDMHPTPVSTDTPGMLIHATAIASMLTDRPVRTSPEWFNWLLAIALCAVFVYFNLLLKQREGGELMMRAIQLAMLVMIIAVGSLVYLRMRLNIDFTRPLLMVGTAALAVDICCGVAVLLKNKHINRKKK